MTIDSAASAENYREVVSDIAFIAGDMVGRGQLEISDSRQLMSDIATWAKDFEAAFDRDRHGDDYMELVDDYAVVCLRGHDGEIRAFLERMLTA